MRFLSSDAGTPGKSGGSAGEKVDTPTKKPGRRRMTPGRCGEEVDRRAIFLGAPAAKAGPWPESGGPPSVPLGGPASELGGWAKFAQPRRRQSGLECHQGRQSAKSRQDGVGYQPTVSI